MADQPSQKKNFEQEAREWLKSLEGDQKNYSRTAETIQNLSPKGAAEAFASAAGSSAAILKLILTQEQEIRALKTRLEALENPAVINLDKKPQPRH